VILREFPRCGKDFRKKTFAEPALDRGAGGASCQARYVLDLGADQGARASNSEPGTAAQPKSVLANIFLLTSRPQLGFLFK